MLKSIDRISNMIDKGLIKRIFIFDGWNRQFAQKVIELFGNRVEVFVIRNNIKAIKWIRFNNDDCILFYETIINDRGEAKDLVLHEARMGNAFVKVLTEDIFLTKEEINKTVDICIGTKQIAKIAIESLEKNINEEKLIDNIKLLSIEYHYETLLTNYGGDTEIVLDGIAVKFNYKKVKGCYVFIKTDKELSIEEIKLMVFNSINE